MKQHAGKLDEQLAILNVRMAEVLARIDAACPAAERYDVRTKALEGLKADIKAVQDVRDNQVVKVGHLQLLLDRLNSTLDDGDTPGNIQLRARARELSMADHLVLFPQLRTFVDFLPDDRIAVRQSRDYRGLRQPVRVIPLPFSAIPASNPADDTVLNFTVTPDNTLAVLVRKSGQSRFSMHYIMFLSLEDGHCLRQFQVDFAQVWEFEIARDGTIWVIYSEHWESRKPWDTCAVLYNGSTFELIRSICFIRDCGSATLYALEDGTFS